jgi:predicted ribosome quality control (RQC) complex YloA/Tae2 family protein
VSRAELVVGGPALVQAASTELLENGRRALTAALAKSIKRLTRKRDAILDDARRADRAPGLRLEADLLLAHGSQLQRGPRGDGWVDVQDWSEDPPRPRRITLQHDEQPAGRAAKLYHQARRMERGARIAEERWAIAEEQLERVRDLHARCAAATTTAQVDELAAAALACGIRELDEPPAKAGGAGSKRRRGASDAARLPYRRFESSEGHPIWVGRSSRDNDELTLRHAKPHHLWLHVEGRSGSHVVVPLSRGATASSELLVDAAQLAAHFSGARDERVVEVIHAERRHVVKPRGYPAGAVRVDRRKTLLLRQEPGRLASLLARELRI